jgi:RNA polymerase-interacting CarD/CdnL/TRCF family regulator
VIHPVYGFGVVEGTITRDQAGQAMDYYNVRLSAGSMLTVPVSRAASLGLRLIVNSLASIVRCLRSPAQPLSDNDRQRVLELKARWQAPEPTALAGAVRDLLDRRRIGHLTPSDKKWLTLACERLSTEAALVDSIEQFQASAAIQQEIDLLQTRELTTPALGRLRSQRNKKI